MGTQISLWNDIYLCPNGIVRRLPWEPESCAILTLADVDWDYSRSKAAVKVAWSTELTVLEPVQTEATKEAGRRDHEASDPRDSPVYGAH